MQAAVPARERLGLILRCEGMGDSLFAQSVIRALRAHSDYDFDLFTANPGIFKACPYVDQVFALGDPRLKDYPHQRMELFNLDNLPHWRTDTFDFISIPIGLGGLSFREKQLEYFPTEPDEAQSFDVVLNTSMTWETRSWPIQLWQRLADDLLALGFSVATVGKDVTSAADGMTKRSPALQGVMNLANRLSLDQTYYTLCKAGLFVTGQNGLSVLAGATETRIVVLGMSIEWSKRAIYRHEDPHHKVTYVSGTCERYCGRQDNCNLPEYQGELRCVPKYQPVHDAVLAALRADDR
jgi:ADP-heptose:LPS heptosyltransferase